MTDPRARFQALLEELSTGVDTLAAQAALEQEILDLFRERFPKSRVKIPEKREDGRWQAMLKKVAPKLGDDFDRICNEHRARHNEALDKMDARRKEIKGELAAIADDLEIQHADEARKFYEVHSSSYHTQGFGAASYARADAERHARDLTFHGIEVEVRKVEGETFRTYGPFGRSVTPITFEVWAKCSETDYQIARYKEGMTLAQQLQWCWNRSINPRVMNPWLPHGLEEKLGVSFLPVRDDEGNLAP